MDTNSPKVETRLLITNSMGLHARPAMAFVDIANSFTSDIRVAKGQQQVDGKSIMQMMMLGAVQGTELDLIVQGPDSEAAAAALRELVDRQFDEK